MKNSIIHNYGFLLANIWKAALFGLSGILVFFVTRSYNTRLYEEEKELSALARRQEYIRRTMLFKEYAKEIRLTKIYRVLSGYFENVVLDKLRVICRHEGSWRGCMMFPGGLL